jgi:diguanylate cyclase (GGDEF)-like protein/PAS domain S-box-containing protein
VFGWEPEELVGRSTRVLYRSDEEYEEIAGRFYPLLEKQQSYSEEFPCRTKDGRDIVCRISASRIGETLKEKGIVVIYEDITERKQAESALMESENMFKGLVEGSIAGVYIIQDGVFKYVNQRFAEIHGYTVEEMVGKLGVKETILPEDQSIVEENIRKRLSGKADVVHFTMRAVRKDKKIIHVEVYGTHMMYQGKQAVMGTLIDITERKRAEDALKRAEEKYRNIFENAMIGIYQSTPEGRYLSVNPAMARIFGYSSPEEMIKTITNAGLQTYVNPDDRIRFKKLLESGGVVGGFETQRYRKDKGKFWVSINNRAVFDESGKVLYYEGIVEDITARKEAEEALRESEIKFRSLFEGSRDAIYITTKDGRFIDANQSFLDLFGDTREGLMERNAKDAYISIEDKERFKKMIKEQGAVRDYEIKLQKKDGAKIDCLLTVTPKRNDRGDVIEYQGIVRDITERKRTGDLIKHLAYHDPLTDLPNRLLFNDRLNMAMISAQRNKQKLAVMMLDLDKFKDVNDTLGHNIGDMLLKAVANCLTVVLRKGDTTARLGGDEFLLLLTNIVKTENTGGVAQKILEAFQKPFVFDGQEVYITTSIGIAIYPEDGEDIDTLIKHADIAMYSAKKAGRNAYQYHKA